MRPFSPHALLRARAKAAEAAAAPTPEPAPAPAVIEPEPEVVVGEAVELEKPAFDRNAARIAMAAMERRPGETVAAFCKRWIAALVDHGFPEEAVGSAQDLAFRLEELRAQFPTPAAQAAPVIAPAPVPPKPAPVAPRPAPAGVIIRPPIGVPPPRNAPPPVPAPIEDDDYEDRPSFLLDDDEPSVPAKPVAPTPPAPKPTSSITIDLIPSEEPDELIEDLAARGPQEAPDIFDDDDGPVQEPDDLPPA